MKDFLDFKFNEEDDNSNPLDKYIRVMGKKNVFNKKEQLETAKIIKQEFLQSPEFAKEILVYMKTLGDNNKKIHDKVIDAHQDTINKLFQRLESPNLKEGEIDLIYEFLKDLSEKIESARKDYSELTKKVFLGGIAIIGTALVAYNTGKNNNYADDEESDYLEAEYKELN